MQIIYITTKKHNKQLKTFMFTSEKDYFSPLLTFLIHYYRVLFHHILLATDILVNLIKSTSLKLYTEKKSVKFLNFSRNLGILELLM